MTTQPERPRRRSDRWLARSSAAELEAELRAQERYLATLEADDPGVGRGGKEAALARRERLLALEEAGRELVRLQSALELNEEHRAQQGLLERARRSALRKVASGDPDNRRFLAELAAKVRERERLAERRRALRERREQLARAANPRASAVTAAVFASPELWHLVRRLPRPACIVNEAAGVVEEGVIVEAVLELADVATLFAVLRALEKAASVTVTDYAGAPRLDIPDLPAVASGLRASLTRLTRKGLLELEEDGGSARLRYGPESLRIAKAAGVIVT
jgi:hypothetical protein